MLPSWPWASPPSWAGPSQRHRQGAQSWPGPLRFCPLCPSGPRLGTHRKATPPPASGCCDLVSKGPPQDLSVHLWYAGPMERAGAENILTNRSDGTFLVRQRVKDAAEFAISIKYNVEVKHIKITTSEGLYRITEKKAFRGLLELVEFYQQNSLKDCFKSLDTTLQFPYKEPERRAISKPPAGSTKYFGTAKARYDFCAKDRSELSLKEGDIIRILSKKGQQGWWRGEIYGRIGWFPSNYVEEDYSEYC